MPLAAQRAQDEPPLVPGRARHASDLAVRGRQRGPRDLRARELEPQLLLRHHLVRVPVPGDLLHAAAAVDDVETRLPGTASAFLFFVVSLRATASWFVIFCVTPGVRSGNGLVLHTY